MTEDEIKELIAQDTAAFFLHMIENFKNHPGVVVNAITHGLAKYTSCVAVDPQRALNSIANVMSNTDYKVHRQEYFALTLGVHDVQKPKITLLAGGGVDDKPL